jgi:hypothetical protein
MEDTRGGVTDQNLLGSLLGKPLLTWILIGFLVSYLLFFVRPIFLNPNEAMFFPRYVPSLSPIGIDLSITLKDSRAWLVEHHSPYVESSYPPLAYVLFLPLVLMPYRYAYLTISLLTITSFGVSTLWFPHQAAGRRLTPTALLLAVTGFLSYGFQFELERGQFNVIAMALALAAIGLFHRRPRLRLISYLLLTLAIQLKVYPAILIVAFISDWRNWKKEGARILAILILNAACLLALGPRVFSDFIDATKAQMWQPYIWRGNHSALSFASQLLPSCASPLALAILALLAACIGGGIWRAHSSASSGLDPYLLLACTVGALIIPSVSHDYTLPLLVAPVAIFLGALQIPKNGRTRAIVGIGVLFIMSLAYSSTLFSYPNKGSLPLVHARIPPILTENSLPALLLVLLAATGLLALGFVPSREAVINGDGKPPGNIRESGAG